MPKEQKETAEWFKHDFDMRNDDKIMAVRRKFKHEGYSIWNMLLEKLIDSKGFEIEYDDLNLELWAGDFDIDCDRLKEIVEYFIKIKLLTLIDGVIFSPTLKYRFAPLIRKREVERIKYSTTKSSEKDVSDVGKQQSRVEKSRVEYKTENADSVLSYPFGSTAFMDTWQILRHSKKWKRKQSSALQASLNKLGNHPEQVAIEMMNDSIGGEYQGLFPPKNGMKVQINPKIIG